MRRKQLLNTSKKGKKVYDLLREYQKNHPEKVTGLAKKRYAAGRISLERRNILMEQTYNLFFGVEFTKHLFETPKNPDALINYALKKKKSKEDAIRYLKEKKAELKKMNGVYKYIKGKVDSTYDKNLIEPNRREPYFWWINTRHILDYVVRLADFELDKEIQKLEKKT